MKILIISDIHGNLAALEAVLEAVEDANLIVCLGDLVDYGPQPAECVKRIHELTGNVVMGNHDYAVGMNFDPGCSPAYRHLAEVTRDDSVSRLDSKARHYLATLPTDLDFDASNLRFSAVHARPSNALYGYMPPDTPDAELEDELSFDQDPDMLLVGHTHLPMIKRIGPSLIINPGSVGQPKDGDPRASYALWENGEAFLCRAEYDVWKTAEAYKNTQLEPRDVARLIAILRLGGTEGP